MYMIKKDNVSLALKEVISLNKIGDVDVYTVFQDCFNFKSKSLKIVSTIKFCDILHDIIVTRTMKVYG